MKIDVLNKLYEKCVLAPKVQREDVDYLSKKDFGRVPNYLEKIKSNIMNEYTMIQEMHRQEQEEQEKQKFTYFLT